MADEPAEGTEAAPPPPARPRPRPEPQPAPAGSEPAASEPYGSIIQRFRGTPWDATPEPAPAPRRGPRSDMLIAAGGVTLVALAVLVVLVLPPGQPAQTPAASRLILTPPPTPGPEELVEAAFWAAIGQPTLSYHVAIDGRATEGKRRLTQKVSLDVHADDYTGTADLTVRGVSRPLHLVLLRSSGVLYVKNRGDSRWRTTALAGQVDIRTRPFLGLQDVRQLVPGGTVERDGAVLHRLLSTELYRPPVTQVIPLSGAELPQSTITLELLVTDDGTPVEATLTAHVAADLSLGLPAIDATATYAFSQVGQVGPIATPKL